MQKYRRWLRKVALAVTLGLTVCAGVLHAENMIGPQSQNEGLQAVPRPGKVTIDGDLSEWDWSGRIWIIPHMSVRSKFSVEAATMWDKDFLYLGFKWKDPTPMHSMVDPEIDPGRGWVADAAQLNIRTDQSLWLFLWHYAGRKQPAMRISYWNDPKSRYGGQHNKVWMAEPGGTQLGDGAELAYQENPEGDGYTQEAKIPWSLLYNNIPSMKGGEAFNMGFEVLWGDPTGNTWPILRYADNMMPGVTSREFFWGSPKPWGQVTLVDRNNIETRRYVSSDGLLKGTIPIRFQIPKKADRFTVVVESKDGKRLRNLAADFDPNDYQVAENEDTRTVEILWDGLTDKGALVEPGTYNLRGLTHNGLDARYEMCFYNPGTPPWGTQDSSGGWGADHSAPWRIARAGDWMIASWKFAEGGHGIIGIGPDGNKHWGEKRGAKNLAADDTYLYAEPHSWNIKGDALMRMKKESGDYAPFVLDGEDRPFELPLSEVFGDDVPGKIMDMDVRDGVLALAMASNVVALLDAESAAVLKTLSVPSPAMLAYAPNGELVLLSDGKLSTLNPESGNIVALPISDYDECAALAVDLEGNILVADLGADMQIKAFSREGNLIYTCGKQGGRAIRGPYDPLGIRAVSSIDVDDKGQIWEVEHSDLPRRIVVWGQDGALVREYLGNTEYAGTGCFLHESDPYLGYVGPMEFALDKTKRSAKLTRILWEPDREAGETFRIAHNDHANGTRFTSDISGQPREYMFDIPYRYQKGYVLYMEEYDRWRPVAAVTTVARIACGISGRGTPTSDPDGEFADLDPYDGVFWNDDNGDGKVQRAECEIVKTDRPYGRIDQQQKKAAVAIPLGSGWGGRIGSDFAFYGGGGRSELTRYAPIGFSKDGAPRYGSKGMSKVAFDGGGSLVPVVDEGRLLIAPSSGGQGSTLSSVDPQTGALQWSYPNPYPGVHGSHKATMPAPGLVIGPLKIMGVADVSDEAGKVFVMRGNLGQDFFLTTDGLYVGALFQDGRLPSMSLPSSESQLLGMPMSPFTEGGEPFNGWFGKQADGKIRMTTGMARQAPMIIEIKGLKSIRRFDLPALRVSADQLAKADADNVARAAAKEGPKEMVVARMPLDKNGKPSWKLEGFVEMKREGQPLEGKFSMAYDDENLYVQYDIDDRTPWKNEGKDFTRLFKTGDAVDLQLCVDAALSKEEKRRGLKAGDVRVLISQVGGKDVAVLMKPIDETAPESAGCVYHSPVTDKSFDRVEIIEEAYVRVNKRGDNQYNVRAAIPLNALGLDPKPGLVIRGDVGFILSDADGLINTARIYWSNKDTNLVNDMPMESWLYPATWSPITFE